MARFNEPSLAQLPPAPMPAGAAADQPGLLDPEGRIAVELRCVRCGYNLNLQPGDSRCPECGEPCLTSLNLSVLRRCPAAWLDRVAGAVQLVWLGLVGVVLSFFLSFVPLLGLVVSLAATVMLLIAMARFNPARQGLVAGAGGVTLWLLRYGGWGLLVPIVALMVLTPLLTGTADSSDASALVLGIILLALLLLMIVKFAAVPWAIFRWLGRLMELAPNPRLGRLCRVTSWLWFWGFLVGGLSLVGFVFALLLAFEMAFSPGTVPSNQYMDSALTTCLVSCGLLLVLSGLAAAASVLMALIFLPGVRRVMLTARNESNAAMLARPGASPPPPIVHARAVPHEM